MSRKQKAIIMQKGIKINLKYLLPFIFCGSVIIFLYVTRLNEHDNLKLEQSLNLPTIYAITPTYYRPEQKAELTRLAQTLMLVPNIHWIVIEDAKSLSHLVKKLLNNTKIKYTHLVAETTKKFKLGNKDKHWSKARGVEQRNKGLEWIRQNLSLNDRGVIYFMDDDNVYSIQLFKEMSTIKNVGVWPVGLVGGLMVEKPIVDVNSKKVTGFNSMWKPERPFPIDMAGFAVNLRLILENKEAVFSHQAELGLQETEILRYLILLEDLEPLASLCTEVFVWHTRTEKTNLVAEGKHEKKYNHRSDDGMEV